MKQDMKQVNYSVSNGAVIQKYIVFSRECDADFQRINVIKDTFYATYDEALMIVGKYNLKSKKTYELELA